MTSMLFTDRRAWPATAPGPALLLLRAIARGVAELLALLDGGRLDLRAHHLAHRRYPLGDDRPLLAVPLLEQHGAVALVVLARHLDGMGQALHPELLEALVGQVQVLEPPAELLAGRRLVAELRHGRANG